MAASMETGQQIIDILTGLKPDIDFANCVALIDDSLLDSFDIISIVTELNDNFDIRIPASEVNPNNFNSAGAITDMVKRLLE